MNFGVIKARMMLNCMNLQASDPRAAYVGNMANDALRMMILRASQRYPNFELFPEHKDVEWDDITVATQNYLALPADQIAIQRAYSSDLTTSPNYNTQQWRVIAYIEPDEFDQLPKTQTGFPLNWTQREGLFKYWPTTTAAYVTYVKLDGIEDEPDMSSDAQTPRTHFRWHPAWLDCGTHLLADACDLPDVSTRFLASADQKITDIGQSMVGLRRGTLKRTVRVGGMPSSSWSGRGRWW